MSDRPSPQRKGFSFRLPLPGSKLGEQFAFGGYTMPLKLHVIVAAGILLSAASIPAAAAANSSDACSLLTQSQVSAAVSAQVSAGAYVMPTFKATCTWTAPGKIVTLMTEGLDAYNASKNPPSPMIKIKPASGIGDEAFYVVIGEKASLFAKKGSVAFKTSVYSNLPLDQLMSIESSLAKLVASEL
jgi:hypothetical protein